MKPLLMLLLTITGHCLFTSCHDTRSYPPNQSANGQSPPIQDQVVAPRPKTVAELRQELAQQEAAEPTRMLSITGRMQENKIQIQKPDFFHHSKYKTDGYLISGIIKNKASIATFKDATIRVTFYTETNTELDASNSMLYKYFLPTQATQFELKVYPPENFKNFALQIMGATAVKR